METPSNRAKCEYTHEQKYPNLSSLGLEKRISLDVVMKCEWQMEYGGANSVLVDDVIGIIM